MSNINILNEYIKYTETSTKKIIKLVVGKYFKEDIYNELFTTYQKVRYYNSLETKTTDFYSNINHHLNNTITELKTRHSDIKYLDELLNVYKTILYLDDLKNPSIKKLATNLEKIQNEKFNINNKNFVSEFITLIEQVKRKKEVFINQFDTNKFTVKYYLTNHKKVYNTYLEHNLNIPNLYSETAINNVYTKGKIKEDKLFILYYLVTSKILKSVINGSFNYHYIIDIATSLFEKEEKLNRLLLLIDNDLFKEKTSFKIEYKDYIANKDKILTYINKGFNFSLVLDDTYKHSENEAKNLSLLFKYITVNINEKYYHDFSNYPNIIKNK